MKHKILTIILVIAVIFACFSSTAYASISNPEDILADCVTVDSRTELMQEICRYFKFNIEISTKSDAKAYAEETLKKVTNDFNKGKASQAQLSIASARVDSLVNEIEKAKIEKEKCIAKIKSRTVINVNLPDYNFTADQFYFLLDPSTLSLDDLKIAAQQKQNAQTDEQKALVNAAAEQSFLTLNSIYSDIKIALVEYNAALQEYEALNGQMILGLLDKSESDKAYFKIFETKFNLFSNITDFSISLLALNQECGGKIANDENFYNAYLGQ